MSTAKRMGVCALCARERVIRARGLCGTCYNKSAKHRRDTGVDLAPPRTRLSGPEYLERSTGGTTMCWPWVGPLTSHGYGAYLEGGGRKYAHRVAYEKANGPIPDGYTVDHTCRVRSCVNPDHLEAVTRGENLRRAVEYRTPQRERLGRDACTHDGTDVYVDPDGKRVCRPCRRERTRLWRHDPDNRYKD